MNKPRGTIVLYGINGASFDAWLVVDGGRPQIFKCLRAQSSILVEPSYFHKTAGRLPCMKIFFTQKIATHIKNNLLIKKIVNT